MKIRELVQLKNGDYIKTIQGDVFIVAFDDEEREELVVLTTPKNDADIHTTAIPYQSASCYTKIDGEVYVSKKVTEGAEEMVKKLYKIVDALNKLETK